MKSLLAVFALFCAFLTPAFATDNAALAPVHMFVGGLNKNDAKTAAAAFAANSTLTDEFAPFSWSGSDAFMGWYKDFGGFAQKNSVTEPALKLVKRQVLSVEGDHAYYVASALFTFKQAGKAVTEHGLVAFSLVKTAEGWRISSFTWSTQS
jgi:hypothetical protein